MWHTINEYQVQYNSIGRFVFVCCRDWYQWKKSSITNIIHICLSVAFCFGVFLLFTLWIILAYEYWIWIWDVCVFGVWCMSIFILDFQLPTYSTFNSLFCCVVSCYYIIHTYTYASISYFDDKYTYVLHSTRNRSAYESTLMCYACALCLLLYYFFFCFFIRFCSCCDHFTWYTFESTLLRHLVSGLVSLLSPEPWATWLFDDFLFILIVCFGVCCAFLCFYLKKKNIIFSLFQKLFDI